MVSEYIELSKDGIQRFDDGVGRFLTVDDPVFTELRKHCVIRAGTTLGDIFRVMDQFPILKVFFAQYSWCKPLEEFHTQARLPAVLNDEFSSQIKYLEIARISDSDTHIERIKHKDGKRETTIAVDFKKWLDFVGKDDEGNRYGVSATPMNEIAHLEIRLNEKTGVYMPYIAGRVNDQQFRKLFDTEEDFSLQEVLDAIYWDISFYGGPEDNKNLREEMNEAIEEIECETSTVVIKGLKGKTE